MLQSLSAEKYFAHQICNHILLLRPKHFGFNPFTAQSNAFQQEELELDAVSIARKARKEFDRFSDALYTAGIQVVTFQDTDSPEKTDAVFPNNWFSTHQYVENGNMIRKLFLYPMFAPNRRPERRKDIIAFLKAEFPDIQLIDLSHFEAEDKFLEGTGSLVIDHTNKVVYGCQSVRTHQDPFQRFCEELSYTGILFNAEDPAGIPFYHTNVMMALGTQTAIICMDAIVDADRDRVKESIEAGGRLIIPISFEQVQAFAGNMLQVQAEEKRFWVLSQQAFNSLTDQQKESLTAEAELLPIAVDLIEKLGGGSVRCMMAEIFFE